MKRISAMRWQRKTQAAAICILATIVALSTKSFGQSPYPIASADPAARVPAVLGILRSGDPQALTAVSSIISSLFPTPASKVGYFTDGTAEDNYRHLSGELSRYADRELKVGNVGKAAYASELQLSMLMQVARLDPGSILTHEYSRPRYVKPAENSVWEDKAYDASEGWFLEIVILPDLEQTLKHISKTEPGERRTLKPSINNLEAVRRVLHGQIDVEIKCINTREFERQYHTVVDAAKAIEPQLEDLNRILSPVLSNLSNSK